MCREDLVEKMRREIDIVRNKFPFHVPILVHCKSKECNLQKTKFLIHGNLTFAQFMMVLRKKITNLNSYQGIFLLVNNTMIPSYQTIDVIHSQHKDHETGMLIVTACIENTFGTQC